MTYSLKLTLNHVTNNFKRFQQNFIVEINLEWIALGSEIVKIL